MEILILFGIVAVAGYMFSLRVHPLKKCPACKMTGRHFGAVYSNRYRRCRMCGGTGRKDRLGAKLFFGGTDDSGIYPKR